MNCGEPITFCTAWNTEFLNAADRRLSTHFWLAYSISGTGLFISFSTCIGIPAAEWRTKSCSLATGSTGTISIFASRSLETVWSANTWMGVSNSGFSAVSKKDPVSIIGCNLTNLSRTRRALTVSTADVFGLYNSKSHHCTQDRSLTV